MAFTQPTRERSGDIGGDWRLERGWQNQDVAGASMIHRRIGIGVEGRRRVRTFPSPQVPDPQARWYLIDALRDAIGDHEEIRSEEHTSELQSLMRISYAVFCLKKKKNNTTITQRT